MNVRFIRLVAGLGVAGTMILGACQKATQTLDAITTPTVSIPSATRRPTHLSLPTFTPRSALPGAAYPAPLQTTEKTVATALQSSTQAAYPGPAEAVITPNAYPAPGTGAPTQPEAYPGPNYIPPTLNPYPGPGTQPPPNLAPTTAPPVTTAPHQPSSTPTPLAKTPTPVSTRLPVTPTPMLNTFTPTPTFPLSFGDAQFHVTDPAMVKLVSGGYQLVEFFAYWCGTCRAMAPVLNGLEARYNSHLQFVYLDIDNPATQPLKDALHFRIEPEYYLLDGQGKVIKQWSGYVSGADFQSVFDAIAP